jgi:opacity protein-like surface antigen
MDNIRGKYGLGLAVLLMCIVVMPLAVSAEWYADLYGGGAFTSNTTGTQNSTFGPSTLTGDLKVDSSITGGGRAGYWFNSLPYMGAGLDIFYFQPDIPTQTVPTTITSPFGSGTAPLTSQKYSISVIGIGFDVLRLRLPLMKTEEFPHGRVQPYLTAGPALFISKVKDSGNFVPANQSKTDTSIGLKAGAGLAFHLTRAIALFGEYRFTHFKADVTFNDSTEPPSQENIEATLNTHHVIGGISFRFN